MEATHDSAPVFAFQTLKTDGQLRRSSSTHGLRRRSSNISINDDHFQWLKGYLKPNEDDKESDNEEDTTQHAKGMKRHASFAATVSLDDGVEDGNALTAQDGQKKRKKLGWTNTEDLAILVAARRIGSQWGTIANHLPGRTADAVRNRWHRLQKRHSLRNSEEGRAVIDSLLLASGIDPNWSPIGEGEEATNGRDSTASRDSRGEHSKGEHSRTGWAPEEDRLIEEGVRRFGCKWRQIRELLPNRSDSSVRNRWMRICRERGKQAPTAPPSSPDGSAEGEDSSAHEETSEPLSVEAVAESSDKMSGEHTVKTNVAEQATPTGALEWAAEWQPSVVADGQAAGSVSVEDGDEDTLVSQLNDIAVEGRALGRSESMLMVVELDALCDVVVGMIEEGEPLSVWAGKSPSKSRNSEGSCKDGAVCSGCRVTPFLFPCSQCGAGIGAPCC